MENNDIKVKDLSTTTTLSTDNQLLVLTDTVNNTVQNITVADFINNTLSSDLNNALELGEDDKLYIPDLSSDIGDLDNLTTTNKSSLVSAINEINNDVNNIDTNTIPSAKGYTEHGQIYTDTTLYNDVVNNIKSSFDLSKFTIVGSPTIENGVVSGFSSSNYLTCTLPSQTSSNIVINGKFKTNNIVSSQEYIFCGSQFYFWTNNGKLKITVGAPGNYFISALDIGSVSAQTEYEFKFIFTSSSMKFYLNGTLVKTQSIINFSMDVSNILGYIGVTSTGSASWQGSIDLKYFSVSADGSTVFTGKKTGTDTYTINGSTVSIPYIVSATGSKIVDSAYRTDVQSVYEANGSALYYTIDETEHNVTLPMGEVYGFIQNSSWKIPVEIYSNGVAGYKVYKEYNPKTGNYVGLWCEEWGETDGTNGQRDINFTNTFKENSGNVYYHASFCFGQTTTFSATGVAIQNISLVNATGTGFSIKTAVTNLIRWKVEGYLAE